MKLNRKAEPGNSKSTVVGVCIGCGLAIPYLYFVRGETFCKILAVVILPLVIIFAIYSYFHEKKDNRIAEEKATELTSESYYDSVEWKDKYLNYRMKHDFVKPKKKTMKKDMISHCRQREDWVVAVPVSILIALSSVGIYHEYGIILACVAVLFSIGFFIFYISLSTRGIREWYTHDCDFEMLEKSYLNGKFLFYHRNGIGFGTTHIHGFTKSKVYAIDYRLAENITRKVVRVKEYQDSLYGKSRYEHYAVIHVRLPESGRKTEVYIELDEFQVQMAIDEFKKMKYTCDKDNCVAYEETFTNETVVM